MLTTQSWTTHEQQPLDADSLRDLFNNKIPAIRIREFASVEECVAYARAAENVGFDFYEGVSPPIGKIGITQFEKRRKDKREYFDQVHEATVKRLLVARRAFDPLERLRNMLTSCVEGNVAIAEDPDMGLYFAGLVRQIRVALLHLDFAGLDAPDWSIGKVDAQVAWNLYLQAPQSGGQCIVYNRPWVPADEVMKIPDSYGYRRELVSRAETHVIEPRVGDLVLHNTRNYHEVVDGAGERLTASSFVGRNPSGGLDLWS